MELIFCFFIFLLISIFQAVSIYLLIRGEIPLREAYKLTSLAAAFNRLFFTGSGYIAGSYFFRAKNLTAEKCLSAFLILEAVSVSPWLVSGIYFGAKIAIKIPVFILLVSLIFFVTFLLKRKKAVSLLRNFWRDSKNIGSRIFLIIPFVFLNIVFYILYYFYIFKFFDFTPGLLSIIKISSIAITIGYLSPIPTGLGLKEGALTLLLTKNGLALNKALSCAIVDRVFITFFWGLLGTVFGYNLIKGEIKKFIMRTIKRENAV